MSDLHYFEDLEIGTGNEWGAYELVEEEIIEIASRFDPQPWHLDHEAARESVFGGLVACACHLQCVMAALHNQNPQRLAVVAGLGQREVRMNAPGRVGTVVRMRSEVVGKRRSASRPTTGIVELRSELVDEDDRVVVETVGVVLVHCRPEEG